MKKINAVLVAVLFAATAAVADTIINEKFAADPAQGGWQAFGDTNLFTWDAAHKVMDVTWDSTRPNSYFYHPLGASITTTDSFCVQFDLQLSNAAAYAYGQSLAIGLLHWKDATNASFSRTLATSPNVFEFDYYPAYNYGGWSGPDTVAASIVDDAGNFNYRAEVQSLLPGVTYHIVLLHYANSIDINGVIYTNGQAMSTFVQAHNYYPANDDGAFVFDTLSVNSYADDGFADEDIFAQGTVANFSFASPLPMAAIQTSVAGQTWFASNTNWIYTLEQSGDFATWSPAATPVVGNGTNLLLQATNMPGDKTFYRVRADLP